MTIEHLTSLIGNISRKEHAKFEAAVTQEDAQAPFSTFSSKRIKLYENKTLLHVAAESDNPEAVLSLLRLGAAPHAMATRFAKDGIPFGEKDSPLHLAAYNDNINVLMQFKNFGIAIDDKTKEILTGYLKNAVNIYNIAEPNACLKEEMKKCITLGATIPKKGFLPSAGKIALLKELNEFAATPEVAPPVAELLATLRAATASHTGAGTTTSAGPLDTTEEAHRDSPVTAGAGAGAGAGAAALVAALERTKINFLTVVPRSAHPASPSAGLAAPSPAHPASPPSGRAPRPAGLPDVKINNWVR